MGDERSGEARAEDAEGQTNLEEYSFASAGGTKNGCNATTTHVAADMGKNGAVAIQITNVEIAKSQ